MGIHRRGQVGVGHNQHGYKIEFSSSLPFGGGGDRRLHPQTPSNSRGGDFGSAGQTGTRRDGTALLVLILSYIKTGLYLASHSKSKTPELKVYQAKTFPLVILEPSFTRAQKGHVGGNRRHMGTCLPSHSGAQKSQTSS